MTDRASPNLPSRDFDGTARFYGALGFVPAYRDEGWMILERGALVLEFFPHPELDPAASWFSCCLRLDDVDAFHAACRAAGVPEQAHGFPRLHAPRPQPWGGRMGALLDPDGTLLRFIQN
ncbi:bleomycin resistance protein [Vulcaniibacterium tengchongense]|uniref:Bleomycin resistance protein n=1 Tax=Vulcaniibacterium tengchongense TaxID=1273429 RepID=A0A3N4VJN6_9GAMM|nr:bleomycin resistance protein [Vulcaniibacterium tengchongense]RPE77237.1 putative lactoylglutathione lyase [Vulcaniibacterium tengchongense]